MNASSGQNTSWLYQLAGMQWALQAPPLTISESWETLQVHRLRGEARVDPQTVGMKTGNVSGRALSACALAVIPPRVAGDSCECRRRHLHPVKKEMQGSVGWTQPAEHSCTPGLRLKFPLQILASLCGWISMVSIVGVGQGRNYPGDRSHRLLTDPEGHPPKSRKQDWDL